MTRRPKRFRLLADVDTDPSGRATAGSVVFESMLYDYGLARDDSVMLGCECKSVTHESDGGYPFFVARVSDLEELTQE